MTAGCASVRNRSERLFILPPTGVVLVYDSTLARLPDDRKSAFSAALCATFTARRRRVGSRSQSLQEVKRHARCARARGDGDGIRVERVFDDLGDEIELFPLYALLILPAAGFLVRLFMIQHDCAHRSFFPSRRANDYVGRLIGIATLTPHDHWRASHAFHHASSGDLDRRGIGDVLTLTVAEYLALSPWGRLRYRLYRHPAVMFGIGPSFLFLLFNRLPLGFIKKGWRPWLSTMATNFGIVAMLVMLIATIGLRPFLWIYPPTVLVAAAAGVWLFYVQHQFEGTYWARGAEWNAHDAALYGSSHYHLPTVVRWFTANIGMHNVHHLRAGSRSIVCPRF